MTNDTLTVQVLGCGTSTGVPIPGCKCAVCQSEDPRNTRLRASIVVRTREHAVLIDAATDLRQQALTHGLTRVDAVLYTHAHADHILGTDDLRAFNFVTGKPIPCYGTAATLAAIRRTFHYIFEDQSHYEGGMLPQLSLHEFEFGQELCVADLSVNTFKLMHGSMPVAGFRLGDFAYATDCNFIPEESFEALNGVRYLILDGLRERPHGTHFSIEQAITVAQRIGAERTWLTHMTHELDYAETNRQLPDRIELAYDGLEIVMT